MPVAEILVAPADELTAVGQEGSGGVCVYVEVWKREVPMRASTPPSITIIVFVHAYAQPLQSPDSKHVPIHLNGLPTPCTHTHTLAPSS